MFTRIKTVSANGRHYDYRHIVEYYREDGRVRKRIVASLGRLDELLAKGDLQRVVEGMLRCLPQLRLVEAQRQQSLVAESDRVWGPVLVFERLWQELGLDAFFKAIASRRRLGFDLERAVFALVLQRLLSPGSDLQGSKWIRTVEADDGEFDLILFRNAEPRAVVTHNFPASWAAKAALLISERVLPLRVCALCGISSVMGAPLVAPYMYRFSTMTNFAPEPVSPSMTACWSGGNFCGHSK